MRFRHLGSLLRQEVEVVLDSGPLFLFRWGFIAGWLSILPIPTSMRWFVVAPNSDFWTSMRVPVGPLEEPLLILDLSCPLFVHASDHPSSFTLYPFWFPDCGGLCLYPSRHARRFTQYLVSRRIMNGSVSHRAPHSPSQGLYLILQATKGRKELMRRGWFYFCTGFGLTLSEFTIWPTIETELPLAIPFLTAVASWSQASLFKVWP